MLESLSIQGVILIDRLELKFSNGFTVLTGETGAGKSILLDALGLALGNRATASLINPRHSSASVSAVFSLTPDHPVQEILEENDLRDGETVILRRILTADGKSRAYINDQAVSLGLLKETGSRLVEIHGQFDQLLDAKTHLMALDRFARVNEDVQRVRKCFLQWRQAQFRLEQAEQEIQKATEDQDFLRHSVRELQELSLKEREEESLKTERDFLVNHTKIMEHLQTVNQKLYQERGAESLLREALRSAEKILECAPERFNEIHKGLELALTEIEELSSCLNNALTVDSDEGNRLEEVEERLFKLRAVARKHGTSVAELPDLMLRFEQELKQISSRADILASLKKDALINRGQFVEAAKVLSQKRLTACGQLEKAIKQELAPLKLDKAEIQVALEELPETAWHEQGMESVEFKIQPNPGMPLGPLAKIASGGERSRFMLALKVILANDPSLSLLIFDEIDAGVGGAVAAAIGERMARLGKELQVLAITHAPQVAASAAHQWVVSKKIQDNITVTDVHPLAPEQRQEEIARMLAGEEITQEARAAAAQLLNKQGNNLQDAS